VMWGARYWIVIIITNIGVAGYHEAF